jgi:hypothetical protein
MTEEMKLTHEHLLKVLDYDPAKGVFVWKIARSNRISWITRWRVSSC